MARKKPNNPKTKSRKPLGKEAKVKDIGKKGWSNPTEVRDKLKFLEKNKDRFPKQSLNQKLNRLRLIIIQDKDFVKNYKQLCKEINDTREKLGLNPVTIPEKHLSERKK